MAASIGGYTMSIMRGEVPRLKQRVMVWQSPGYDGYGAMQLGTGEAEFRLTLIRFDTAAAIDTWLGDIEGLAGTLVTITDDFGRTTNNCLIVRILPPKKKAVIRLDIAVVRAEVEVQGVVSS